MSHKTLIIKMKEMFHQYCKENQIVNPKEKSILARQFFDALTNSLEDREKRVEILAPNVVVEALDTNSGLLFRRYLEIDYNESANGLKITGEKLNGEETSFVFLSEHAIEKIHELQGEGSDKALCE